MIHNREGQESERMVLGGILLDFDLLDSIKEKLCPHDFESKLHQEIYSVMISLLENHGFIDIEMLINELQCDHIHEQYIYRLANECSSTKNIISHANIVREKSVQRKLAQVANSIIKEASFCNKNSPHSILITYLESITEEIRNTEIDSIFLKQTLFEIAEAFISTSYAIEDDSED